jgi:hypothetical protein
MQTPQLSAIKSQSGFPAFTGLSTHAPGSLFQPQLGAPANQFWKRIAPGSVPCTGLNPPEDRGVYPHITLDAGVCVKADFPMNARSPFPTNKRSDDSDLA